MAERTSAREKFSFLVDSAVKLIIAFAVLGVMTRLGNELNNIHRDITSLPNANTKIHDLELQHDEDQRMIGQITSQLQSLQTTVKDETNTVQDIKRASKVHLK